ncbi:hypothetical protein [Kiloniella antarctica]|uniref:Uncharacterized protein n=1 Tax=Kiloniella antarctica TaxID=1550907 RepID=A0ABW5BLP4_9PROT
MAQEKARVLRQGLPLLEEMETSDLVDFLLQERRSFVLKLENRKPRLSSHETRHEIESFDEAVQLVLRDQVEAQKKRPEKGNYSNKTENRTSISLSARKEEPRFSIPKDDPIEDKSLTSQKVSAGPIWDKVEKRPENYLPENYSSKNHLAGNGSEGGLADWPEDWPDILPTHNNAEDPYGFRGHRLKAGNDQNDRNHYDGDSHDEDTGGLRAEKRIKSKSIGGPLGMLIGLMVLAIYILLPLLAATSSLVTGAMAWDALINIGVLSGVIAVAIFILTIFSSHRFSYALYAGIVFYGLSYGAHYYAPVRDFIQNEKYILPLIASQMIEGYFQAADYTGLPEKTGALQRSPQLRTQFLSQSSPEFSGEGSGPEANPTLQQRQKAFDQEVEAWLVQ